MTIKVTQKKTFQTKCQRCESQLSYTWHDLINIVRNRPDLQIGFQCPVCNSVVVHKKKEEKFKEEKTGAEMEFSMLDNGDVFYGLRDKRKSLKVKIEPVLVRGLVGCADFLHDCMCLETFTLEASNSPNEEVVFLDTIGDLK